MKENQVIPHLFRTEFSKIVAVICKTFGLSNIQLAEDITSETFLKASETWGLKGIPDKPSAWLYQVAKNKTKDHFKREQIFTQKILPELKRAKNTTDAFDIDLSDDNIKDSQLQMLFAVCNPIITENAQTTLALRVLCGFGIEEIAKALLSNKSTINKRLHRSKAIFRKHNIDLTFPLEEELMSRMDSVLSVLYLLFNEGYYSTSSEKVIKKDLCLEAMRLLYMLLNYAPANQAKTNALMALFCFHSSRFNARISTNGDPILYDKQDVTQWDVELITKGQVYLKAAAVGNQITKYHLESLIAYWHTQINANFQEKWANILQLYNQLIQIEYSPITALNRTYALAMANGKEVALKEALKINLKENHFYHSLLAELYSDSNPKKQVIHLDLALKWADTAHDKQLIRGKLEKVKV